MEWASLLGSRGRVRAKSPGGRSKGLHPAGHMRERRSKGARAGEQWQHEHVPKMPPETAISEQNLTCILDLQRNLGSRGQFCSLDRS